MELNEEMALITMEEVTDRGTKDELKEGIQESG
jgi:hypothetical protein